MILAGDGVIHCLGNTDPAGRNGVYRRAARSRLQDDQCWQSPGSVGDAYLRDAYLDQVVAAHRESDHHAAADRVWDLMMLELWLQHHVDRRAIAAAVPQAV